MAHFLKKVTPNHGALNVVEGDEDGIGPSDKLLCLWQTAKN